MIFILIVALIILGLVVISLRDRVTRLEDIIEDRTVASQPNPELGATLEQLEASSQPLAPPIPPGPATSPPPVVSPPVSPASEPQFTPRSVAHSTPPVPKRVAIPMAGSAGSNTPQPSFDLIAWIKDGFLVKVGALLLFLGVGLFMSYAFRNDWVSPEMRILIGLVLGVGTYGVSVWRMTLSRQQGLVLNALGTAIILATVYAAQFVYGMFNPVFAVALMGAAISVSVFMSLRHDAERLALAAAGAGLFIPFLSNIPQPSLVLFLSYLLVLTVSFVWVVYRSGWTNIILLLLLGVEVFLFGLQQVADDSDKATILLFAGLFALIFYAAALMSNLVRQVVSPPDLLIVGVNALSLLYWIHVLVPDIAQPVVAFLVTAVAAVTAYLLLVNNKDISLAYMHAGVGLIFAFAATAYLFSGVTLTLVFTIEVAFLIAGSMWMQFRPGIVEKTAWLGLVPVIASGSSVWSDSWQDSWLNPDAFALFMLAAVGFSLAGLGYYREYQNTANAFAVFGWLYAALLTYRAVAVATAPANELSVLVIILSLLSAVCLVLVLFFRLPAVVRQFYVFTFALPFILSLTLLDDDKWVTGWWHIHLVALVVVMTTAAVVAVVSHQMRRNELRDAFALATGFYIYAIPWLAFHSVLASDTANNLLVILYGVFTIVALILAVKYRSKDSIVIMAAGSGILPVALSLMAIVSPVWESGIGHSAFLALLTLLFLAAIATYTLALETADGLRASLTESLQNVFAWVTGFYGVVLIWLTTHALFANDNLAISVSLFTYVVTGLVLFVLGRARDVKLLRAGGMVLLSGVVLRLVIVDVWTMDLPFRVLTFAGIGILFLGTSFFETSLHKKTEESSTEE